MGIKLHWVNHNALILDSHIFRTKQSVLTFHQCEHVSIIHCILTCVLMYTILETVQLYSACRPASSSVAGINCVGQVVYQCTVLYWCTVQLYTGLGQAALSSQQRQDILEQTRSKTCKDHIPAWLKLHVLNKLLILSCDLTFLGISILRITLFLRVS